MRALGNTRCSPTGRAGHFDARPLEERSNDSAESDAIGACATIAMQRGAFAKLPDDDNDGGSGDGASSKRRFTAEYEGFNLHAGVHIVTSSARKIGWPIGAWLPMPMTVAVRSTPSRLL